MTSKPPISESIQPTLFGGYGQPLSLPSLPSYPEDYFSEEYSYESSEYEGSPRKANN